MLYRKTSLGLKVFQIYFSIIYKNDFSTPILEIPTKLLQTLYMGEIFYANDPQSKASDCVNFLQFEPSLFPSCRNTNVLTKERVQVDHELNSLAGQSLSFGYKCFPHLNYSLHFIPSRLVPIYFWFFAQRFFFPTKENILQN